jgi:hypothetical protein
MEGSCKYTIEMDPDTTTYMPSVIKAGSGIQKLIAH